MGPLPLRVCRPEGSPLSVVPRWLIPDLLVHENKSNSTEYDWVVMKIICSLLFAICCTVKCIIIDVG